MNPESEDSTPLTPEELAQLTKFLVERGHRDVAVDIWFRAAWNAMRNDLHRQHEAAAA
ncbi:MAG TPA: hypothetical protein VI172_08210 [Candidatus Dormibacteraeota bacterium]|jgi:hypothetical protein